MYRDLIIVAGEETFAAHGFDETKMQDIASAAGVSLKTVYKYFPGKQELYQAIKTRRGGELVAEVEQAVGRLAGDFPREPLRVMLTGMETHLRFFMSHPGYLQIILHEGYIWFEQRARQDPGQEELWQRGRQVMEALFSFGIETGLFVPQPVETMVAHLISLQQTRLATWATDGMEDCPEAVISAAQAEFVRFFCVPALASAVLSPDGSRVVDAVTRPTELLSRYRKDPPELTVPAAPSS